MIKPYILADTNWKQVKDTKYDLAVLPWGATEAHNYHLPYGTDNIEGTAIAEKSAKIAWEKGANVIVLPNMPYGVNTGQSDIYLDMNLNPSTQFAILKDLLQVLNRQGIYKFMILNSHGGNNWKSILRELGLLYPNMFLCFTFWPTALNRKQYFKTPGDHADEMETSLILHLAPNLVLPQKEWGNGTSKKNTIQAFNEGWAWTERPWSIISKDMGVGNPKDATKEKGERFFKDICNKMGQLLYNIAATDIDKFYK